MTLGSTLSDLWRRFQGDLFPALAEAVGPLLETHKRFVTALDLVKVEGFVDEVWTGPGRPREDRRALARGVIAKAVWGLPTTRHLIDRLKVDPTLRRLCGGSRIAEIPREATFSRTFAEWSQSRLPERMHAALVAETLGDALIGHVSRDPTAIEARETPAPTPKAPTPNRKRGRPRKGEERTKEPGRLERQANGMDLDERLDALPKVCDHGAKKNAKGVLEAWRGDKLPIDTADCGVPLRTVLTSASVHDSQVAIPLAMMTAARVTNLYDLMDAAYDAREIYQMSERLGHVPIIDVNPRRDKDLKEERDREVRARRAIDHVDPETVRVRIRSGVERTNARLKDECGGRHVRVRGHSKVACHLMVGILALAADQLIRLAAP